MKAHGLLLQRHAGDPDTRRHDGRVAVDRSNLRWCSDGFEIGCDNGEKVRVPSPSTVATARASASSPPPKASRAKTSRISCCWPSRPAFGHLNRLPQTIEWLTDNGSGYIAGETRRLARDIGLEPRTTPVQSPQSNAWPKPSCARSARIRPVSALPDARRHRHAADLVRALQYRSPSQGTRIFSHRASSSRPGNPSDLSNHSGAITGFNRATLRSSHLRDTLISNQKRNCDVSVLTAVRLLWRTSTSNWVQRMTRTDTATASAIPDQTRSAVTAGNPSLPAKADNSDLPNLILRLGVFGQLGRGLGVFHGMRMAFEIEGFDR